MSSQLQTPDQMPTATILKHHASQSHSNSLANSTSLREDDISYPNTRSKGLNEKETYVH